MLSYYRKTDFFWIKSLTRYTFQRVTCSEYKARFEVSFRQVMKIKHVEITKKKQTIILVFEVKLIPLGLTLLPVELTE